MTSRFSLSFFLLIITIRTIWTATWVKITRPTIIWEDMTIGSDGQRFFYCGEFDAKFSGRYHWRFNGSSILPERTQIHRNQFVFLSGANAIRNQVNGEYECCVRETLGNACYSRLIVVKNHTKTHNVELDESEELIVNEGDTYYIRMIDVKRIEAIKCEVDGTQPQGFKYPFMGKYSKKTIPYHLKIENVDFEGEIKCDIRIQRKENKEKIFRIRFNSANLPHFIAVLWVIFVYF